jgi:uncharacterized protein YjbI with pentapeptide repeats
MDPAVVAAWIAAGASGLTLVVTVGVQSLSQRASTKAAEKAAEKALEKQQEQLDQTFAQQRDQLDRTLAEQSQQLDRTLAEQRTRALNERFATAAEELGSDKPAVRLAGVYAMAGLADDWEENRQTCVDVLCAYLRMPYEPDPGQDAPELGLAFQASREVRHTVIRVITAHLKDDAAVSWQGLTFDFWGVDFDGGDFNGARFSGGTVSFYGAKFSSGTVYFNETEFSGGRVSFDDAQFDGGTVTFNRAQFSDGLVTFSEARFSDGLVTFGDAWFSGSIVTFSDARFTGGMVSFNRVRFFGGRLSFGGAGFDGAGFFGGEITFYDTWFSGGMVDFRHAEFSGAEVDFSEVDDWSVPPAFPWTGTPPVGVKLPQVEDQSPALPGTPGLGLCPDPGTAQTPAEFMDALRAYWARAGKPSYRALESVIRNQRGQHFSASSIHAALTGSDLPALALVQAVVTACGGDDAHQQMFTTAWRRLIMSQLNGAV